VRNIFIYFGTLGPNKEPSGECFSLFVPKNFRTNRDSEDRFQRYNIHFYTTAFSQAIIKIAKVKFIGFHMFDQNYTVSFIV